MSTKRLAPTAILNRKSAAFASARHPVLCAGKHSDLTQQMAGMTNDLILLYLER